MNKTQKRTINKTNLTINKIAIVLTINLEKPKMKYFHWVKSD